jgi:predicted DNA-binding protein (UPF0251 family)
MTRPFINRKISSNFDVTYFKPRGIPLRILDEVCIGVDEMEAIRLADKEGLYQADAAKQMGVSRQTFGNIIKSAHEKLAEALIEGKAIKIEGGPVNFEEKERVDGRCRQKQHRNKEK